MRDILIKHCEYDDDEFDDEKEVEEEEDENSSCDEASGVAEDVDAQEMMDVFYAGQKAVRLGGNGVGGEDHKDHVWR